MSKRNPDITKPCEYCGILLERKRWRNGILEDSSSYGKRIYCDKKCAGLSRMKSNPSENALSDRALKFRGVSCEVCGTMEGLLSVHHINGDRFNNTTANIMTMCFSCHTKWHWQHGKERRPDKKPRKRDGYFRRYANRHAVKTGVVNQGNHEETD